MKKVLFVATVTYHISTFHIPYLKLFKEQGYEVHVASNGDEQIEYCDKHYNLPFERFPLKPNNIRVYKELKRIINENHYEIIHCHTPVGGVITRFVARKARKNGTRVIYTAHGFHFYKGAPLKNWIIYYPIEKICARWTDTLITINQEDYERAKRKFIKAKEIKLLHGVGINTERFDIEITDEDKQKLREKIGVTENNIILSYVAELNNNKNQILLINVMEKLLKENNNYKLLLIGDGPNKEKYKKEIKDRNLIENVFLLGKRKDVPQILSITDIYVASSIREGLPVNIMEAMYMGLPIVATDNRGHRELVKNNNNGYLISSIINYKDFADKVKKINEKEIYLKYAENSKEFVKKFEIENVMQEMQEIYHKKKRILHLLNTNSFSGAENVVCQIIDMFKDEKDFDMYYCSKDGSIRETLNGKNINFIPIKKLNIHNLKKIIKEHNIDLIHAHDIRASFIASFIGKGIPIISHVHGNHAFMRKNTLQSILYNWRARYFRHIYFVSKSSFENYKFKNKTKNKSSILYNVIDKNEIKNKIDMDRENYEFDIIYLGRLNKIKNPMRMIQILDEVIKQKNDTKCAIVGDGEFYEKLEEFIKKNKLEDNIKLFGYQENPYKILNCSKILLMTSINEGLPMVALEAMALGIPIISTPVDGLKELVKNDYNGYLTDSNNELVKNILKLLNNKNILAQLRINIINEFDRINNIENYKKEIKKIYMSK